MTETRKAGRPLESASLKISNIVFVWAAIELLRDRQAESVRRDSVRGACDRLSKLFSKAGADFPASTLRRYHREAQAMLGEGLSATEFQKHVAKLLSEPRSRRAEAGWNASPFTLLGLL